MSLFTKLGFLIAAPVDDAGNLREVVNHDFQVWMTEVERLFAAFTAGGGVVFQSKAQADATLAYAANTMAWVFDSDPTLAGVYQKLGASGTGSWSRRGDLPYSFIRATNAGGTADAILATTPVPIPAADGGALISLSITATNTADAPTVTFNGGAPLTITDAAGTPVSAEGLTTGMLINGYKVGTTFRVDMGPRGWSPLLRVVIDGARRVVELYDWTGGHGAKPDVTGYLGATGIVSDIAQATDIRGPAGPNGPGTGDMLKSVYDPQGFEDDIWKWVDLPSRAFAIASFHPVTAPDTVQVRGYAAAGDGGGALYKKVAVEPSHAGKFSIILSGGGAPVWYEIAPVDSIDPIAIGAIADGVANDATVLTNAVTVAKHFGVPLSFRAGRTYRFTSVQNWGKLPGIIGRGTLKASGIVGDAIVIGGSVGAAKTLSSNRASKGTTLNINAHGISDEAMLWIRSGESCMTASAFGNRQLGDEPDSVRYTEFIQVQTVTDANNLALNGAVYYGYPATTTSVYVVDFLDQLVMKEFTWDNGGTGAINLDWCRNPTIERSVKCIGQTTIAPFWGEHILGGLIAPTVLRAANSDNTVDPAAYQGIKLRDGCQDTVVSPYVVNGEQGVDVTYTPSSPMNGTSRNVRVINGTFIGVNQQAITCHSGLEGLVIEGNLVEDGGDGVSVRSPRCVIRNNKIYGRTISAGTGNEGIRIGNSYANSTIVEGNEVENFETGIIVLGNVATQRRDEIIRANRVRNCRTGISAGAKLSATLLDYGLRITDNEVVDCLISGIVVEDNLNGTVCNGNTVRQELRAALTTYGIRLGIGENLEAINNRGVDIGASVRVLDLATTAYGRFDNNMAVGTTMIADTQQGSTIELEVSIADDAVWSTVIVADVLKLEIISQQTPGNGMAWLRNGAVIHSIGPATFATATGVLTGTTGVDGNVTVSRASTNVYIENRSGVPMTGTDKLRVRLMTAG